MKIVLSFARIRIISWYVGGSFSVWLEPWTGVHRGPCGSWDCSHVHHIIPGLLCWSVCFLWRKIRELENTDGTASFLLAHVLFVTSYATSFGVLVTQKYGMLCDIRSIRFSMLYIRRQSLLSNRKVNWRQWLWECTHSLFLFLQPLLA